MDALDKNLFEDFFSEESKGYLMESAKWGRFLSILGFILLVILVVVAFSIGALLSKFAQLPGGQNMGMVAAQMGTFLTIVYLAIAVLYFFPTYYLFKFSVKMIKALQTTDRSQLTSSFKNLKSMFKFWGIFSIVIVGFYSLLLVIGMIGMLAR